MTTPKANWIKLDIGDVDLDSGQIVGARPECSQVLSPRLRDLLCYLVSCRGEVVTRDDLLTYVWGHLEAASEDSVNVAVSSLRKALGDQRRPFRLIQTLPRRGYRYDGPRATVADIDEPAASSLSDSASSPARSYVLAVSALSIILLGLYFAFGAKLARQPTEANTAAEVEERSTAVSMMQPGIAVLPFLDLSEGGDQKHFADGLVDAILHMLAQVPDLRVVARTSSFAFREHQTGIPDIADQLRVNAILEGSVQRSSSRIRVIAQLVDGAGNHVWSRTYDRNIDDLFDIQDDIATEVSSALQTTLTVTRKSPQQLAVFEQIALGRSEYEKETIEGAEAAKAHYERALELEPGSVSAMIGLFNTIALETNSKGFPSDHPSVRRLFELAGTVYERQPDNPEVIAVKARAESIFGSAQEAEKLIKRATELGPNFAQGFLFYGRLLWGRGAFDEALDQIRIAEDLDPLSDATTVALADAYWSVGRAEEAMARLRAGIKRNPNFPRFFDRMATYLNQVGKTGEAMRYIQAQLALDPRSGMRMYRVCEFYNQLADPDASESCTDQLEATHGMPDKVLYLRQQIAGARGDWDTSRALLLQLRRSYPKMGLIPTLVAMYHSSTDCAVTLDVLKEANPSLFTTTPKVTPIHLTGAHHGVYCLREAGRHDQADLLLKVTAETLERTRLNRSPLYTSGMEGIVQMALAGQHEAALEAYVGLVDSGWRYYWWGLDQYPMLDTIRARPEFQMALQRLFEGVEQQRLHYEALKSQPLL